ncbi:forkhead box Q2 [Dunckerocampus dactyliophorus]|uniref:forkhead box Q2 n=1 Tax=Dunckerocampus dactyliophorus TaxID=161453 RepID=UPI002405994C|nr:forkhead box Q2 [Dunckerocampus dactyliophorus]
MSGRYLRDEMTTTTEDRSSRERLGLSFTIDYLLFNKGVKGVPGTEEQTANNVVAIQEKSLERSAETGEKKVLGQEGDEEQQEEGEEEVTTTPNTTTTMSYGSDLDKSEDKPNQSYIALISKAILASEQKKLLLCDIYQWIMEHFPYFKSKDKNWRNSVRHNLSLNDCFIKAGRSDNGKGHFWAIHPSNYQDFSNGDYHCRRTRRRVRRVAGQLQLSPLSSPYHLSLQHKTACWCCPQVHTLPVSCLAPRLYWPWSRAQGLVGFHPSLHIAAP